MAFRGFVSIFVPRNGSRSCFLFCGMVRSGIPRGYWSTEWNSELFSLPGNGSERNSESLLLFLIHGTEFPVVFSSAEGFRIEFWEFSVQRNSQNSFGNNHLFRLFRLPKNYFFVENSPTLTNSRRRKLKLRWETTKDMKAYRACILNVYGAPELIPRNEFRQPM